MSRLVDQLHALRIVNTHDLLRRFADKGQDVACCWCGHGDSRSVRAHGAHVYSPSHKTDPTAHWTDYGQKRFGGPRDEALPAALAWASEKYGVAAWAVDPTDRNARVPKVVRERAEAAVKAADQPPSPTERTVKDG